jgi:hypothetical protein
LRALRHSLGIFFVPAWLNFRRSYASEDNVTVSEGSEAMA